MSWVKHQIFEKSPILMLVGILVVVSIGGLIEIAPLFWLSSTVEKVKGMRPYAPLELAGRDIYIREGCYVCHSQMIRALRDEVERYGHYSLAAESMYDHPFQWGSKRTGPDLARVGGKYSDEWHRAHMNNPRSVVPESVMPGYPYLERKLDFGDIEDRLRVNAIIGVPYTEEMIESAKTDLELQAGAETEGLEAFLERYPKAQVRSFDRDPGSISELDALIAYMQMLGTLVDFASFDAAGPNLR